MTTRFKKQLPANCYIDKGKYVEFRKQIKGVKHHYQLGKVSDGLAVILENYQAVIDLIEKKEKPNTLGWLSKKFQESRKFKALSKYTKPRYITASKVLEHVGKNGRMLAEMPLNEITKPIMQKIMEVRLNMYKERGLKGESAVNYEVAYLSSMITWGLNYEPEMNIKVNPLLKLEKLKAPKNERYVTHQEYWTQYNVSPPLLQAFYEVQYLCACRAIEVRQLRESDDLGDRLLIRRTKGSKHTYINVSERLRAAIDKAKTLRPKQKITVMGEDRHIFCNANGERIKAEGLKSAMGRIKKKIGSGYWSLHLLKSKGLSDAKDKDMAGLTEAMKKRYDKQIGLHDAVE
ncbi:MAG: hypothetical protein OQK29_01240 [Ignavibacteriaceae bacterium]|nr:hypothetical protein [Ignavibacteriaceae bacterium]